MPDHYDNLETRDPRSREREQFAALPGIIARAMTAPGWAKQLAGVDPRSVTSRAALAKLPVLHKSDVAALQKEFPPFGGLNVTAPGQVRRLLMSPGPIFEPEGQGTDWYGSARALYAAGFRAGDIVHNSFAYHLTPGGFILEADYRAYPARPYLALVLAILLFRYLPSKAAPLVLSALLLYFGVSSWAMNRHYRDDKSFWAQSVRYGGDEVANMSYGMCFRGQDEATAKQYLEKAIQVNPGYYLGYINLGLYYIDHGEKQKGLELVKQGVLYSPGICLDRSLYWLAVAHERVGDYPGAHDAIARALGYNPKDIDYLYEAAFIAQTLARYDEALGYLGVVHQREPNIKISRFIAGWCHQMMGQNDQAVADYQLALRYTPDYHQTYANLGYALNSLGRSREACGYFEKFLELEPGNQGVKAALEACRKSGRP